MSKKRRNRHKTEHKEAQFDFDDAKELTVGEAMRKNEEVEAGVLPGDSILDKYVKQHKDEIEADKFETRQFSKDDLVEKEEVEETQTLDNLLQELREETGVTSPAPEDELRQFDDLELTRVSEAPLVEEFETEEVPLVGAEEALTRSRVSDNEDGNSKKKWVLYGILAALVVLILGTGYYVYRQVAHSTKEIQTSQSTTNTQSDAEEFNNLYDAFYTDSNKTALKNSQFDKLGQLKTLLDKLEGSREYTLAKSKYDSLATQIKAIQDVNAQFDKPAIVDGVLDTNAKAKSDAKFTDIKTGNTEIDKVLDKAISLVKANKQVLQVLAQAQVKKVQVHQQRGLQTTQVHLQAPQQIVQFLHVMIAMAVYQVLELTSRELRVVCRSINQLLMIAIILPGISRMVS